MTPSTPSAARPRLAVAVGLLCLPLAAGSLGCAYYNALYNAQRLYGQAERDRRAGRDSLAREGYARAIEKAANSYRQDTDGKWGDDALYLIGMAHLRQGDWTRARAALDRVRSDTDDPALAAAATLYLGAVSVPLGDAATAMRLLGDGIRRVGPTPLRGEGHLWRARLFLGEGFVDQGWWDLDQAVEADARLAVPAHLERLLWGVVLDDTVRARVASAALLRSREGYTRADTLAALVGNAAERWGPVAASGLLAEAADAPWPPLPRDRALLLRASLWLRAGDTARAQADAERVAAGAGAGAAEARRVLAGLRLAALDDAARLDEVRAVLLPASGDPVVARTLDALRSVEVLAGRREELDPVALFAAAELARDVLDAPRLARALFLEYAAADPGAPWVGKALLAALDLSAGAEAEPVRLRLQGMGGDPYVALSRSHPLGEDEFETLERTLQERLRRVLSGVPESVRAVAPLVREPGDTLGGPAGPGTR